MIAWIGVWQYNSLDWIICVWDIQKQVCVNIDQDIRCDGPN